MISIYFSPKLVVLVALFIASLLIDQQNPGLGWRTWFVHFPLNTALLALIRDEWHHIKGTFEAEGGEG